MESRYPPAPEPEGQSSYAVNLRFPAWRDIEDRDLRDALREYCETLAARMSGRWQRFSAEPDGRICFKLASPSDEAVVSVTVPDAVHVAANQFAELLLTPPPPQGWSEVDRSGHRSIAARTVSSLCQLFHHMGIFRSHERASPWFLDNFAASPALGQLQRWFAAQWESGAAKRAVREWEQARISRNHTPSGPGAASSHRRIRTVSAALSGRIKLTLTAEDGDGLCEILCSERTLLHFLERIRHVLGNIVDAGGSPPAETP